MTAQEAIAARAHNRNILKRIIANHHGIAPPTDSEVIVQACRLLNIIENGGKNHDASLIVAEFGVEVLRGCV